MVLSRKVRIGRTQAGIYQAVPCKYDNSVFHTQSYSDVLTDRQTWREDAGLPINIKKIVEFMLLNYMFHLTANPVDGKVVGN